MPMSLRIALVQADFPVGDIDGNAGRIAERIAEARDRYHADLVLFPELTLSGYPPEDLLLRRQFLAECADAVQRIAQETTGIVAVVGWPEAAGAVVYNAISMLRDGAVAATYRKRDLPNYAVFDERRYFAVDPDSGACVFELQGVTVGLLICQDLWGLEPTFETAATGAQLILVSNASPFERDKHAERDALLSERARDNQVALAYVNLVGGQDAVVFDGASLLADADGQVNPAAIAFEEHVLVADFDPASRTFTQVSWPIDTDVGRDAVAWRAIVCGLRDYCRKNGFDRVWVGLSGGLDSAVVLAMAVDALGSDRVTAVRLPSRFTSALSNDLAAAQCATLGVAMRTVPIDAPFQGFLDTLSGLFAGTTVDATEENLQSRTRGAVLMALSNKLGGLLLTTGNKSEYAVGYTTIYGDMCGGYAPLKDVYKTEVSALARWRNTVGGAPVIPPEVIARPPTAELREHQTDQDTLPPYDVLDAILFRHIDQEQSREELLAAGFAAAVVDPVLDLVRRHEWKRQQAAPGPKISRRAFGRERRYPITNAYAQALSTR
ncbi:NAD+ synthase [Stenotrophomonas maltophilia]|nr:NAD+ synthase [Stenotrophomonas maltophilia]MBC9092302.1 NAD+ synthase [Stenotrophomonas maltophilia]MCF3484193.1 NAD+ synthase [Stenotrophomonas maltophilia]